MQVHAPSAVISDSAMVPTSLCAVFPVCCMQRLSVNAEYMCASGNSPFGKRPIGPIV